MQLIGLLLETVCGTDFPLNFLLENFSSVENLKAHSFLKKINLFILRRLITLQYCGVFCHTLT